MTSRGSGSANFLKTFTFTLAGVAALLAVQSLFFTGRPAGGRGEDWSARVSRATELKTNKLYREAINEFLPLVDNPEVPPEKRANYAYVIGELYLDQLGDYERAAAYFIRARSYNPRPELGRKIGRRLVECFENLGRAFDAARQLSDYTAADEKQQAAPGEKIVARIGEREITLSEVERELQKLPPQAQQEFLPAGKMAEFVRQYVGMELLYQSALRRGVDREPEILAQFAEIKKQLVFEKMLKTEIMDQITVSDSDLEMFYQAHKTDLFEGRPFAEVQRQVAAEFRRLKQREKYSELIDNLITAEPVTIYDDQLP